ncbi:MAG: phosphodiester glycosidase family protein [Ectothiorhodospiraceae bacterium]|nr:phosphodiester glycosidase family protein [Ectothiorhodospiraceae bacterium]MCH8506274.1 phosphodiester glycosidase family protein [Ectothiorhodospiraceae bacterium]
MPFVRTRRPLWRLLWLPLLVLLALPPAGWSSPVEEPCTPHRFEGLRFTVCTVDLKVHSLQLFWRDEVGQPYRAFRRLPTTMGNEQLVFAMNAGMFRPDLSPAGLYIEDGETFRRANTADGPGNFHMKPNGIFLVENGRAAVMTTEQYLEADRSPELATQSGPMLVIDGELHPAFLEDSNSRKRRNGVGVIDERTVVFAITEQPVTFHEFARLFRDDLGTRNALFLDGSMSSLHAPSLGRSDFFRHMGPIIGALAPRERGN